MPINILSTKLLGGAAAAATTLTGGGIGLGIYINNLEFENDVTLGGGGTLRVEDFNENFQSYLEDKTDFVVDKQQNSGVILARVNQLIIDQPIINQRSLTCDLGKEHNLPCRLGKIDQPKDKGGIPKLLYSSIQKIKEPKTESPVGSLIVVDFKNSNKKFDDFKNQSITVKNDGKAIMTVDFEQILFKKSKTVDKQTGEVLMPLKPNWITYLAESKDASKLFTPNKTTDSFICSFQKTNDVVSGSDSVDRTKFLNQDDSCKVFKIDFPSTEEKKMPTFQALLKSKTPLQSSDLTSSGEVPQYFKVELDENKFYNFAFDGILAYENIQISSSSDAEKATFKLMQQITEDGVIGKANLMVVKYKGETKTASLPFGYLTCGFDNTSRGSTANKENCTLHSITTQTNITSTEDVEKITYNQARIQTPTLSPASSTMSINKDTYFVVASAGALQIKDLQLDRSFYLYIDTATADQAATYSPFEFQIIALLSGTIVSKQPGVLLTYIGTLMR